MNESGEDVVRMLVRDYREAWLLTLGVPLGVGSGAVALLFGCAIEHGAALAAIVACVVAMAVKWHCRRPRLSSCVGRSSDCPA